MGDPTLFHVGAAKWWQKVGGKRGNGQGLAGLGIILEEKEIPKVYCGRAIFIQQRKTLGDSNKTGPKRKGFKFLLVHVLEVETFKKVSIIHWSNRGSF